MCRFLTLLICLLLVGCGDNIQSDSQELEKCPWVKTFTIGGQDFSRITHNLDTGRYSFSFRSKYQVNDFFSMVNDHASKDQWIFVRGEHSKKYERPSALFPAAKGKDIVTIEYKDGGEIVLEFQPNVTDDN